MVLADQAQPKAFLLPQPLFATSSSVLYEGKVEDGGRVWHTHHGVWSTWRQQCLVPSAASGVRVLRAPERAAGRHAQRVRCAGNVVDRTALCESLHRGSVAKLAAVEVAGRGLLLVSHHDEHVWTAPHAAVAGA